MARYTGPKSKIARKFGEPIYGPDKALERRNYPSGQHGLARRRRKISEYGVQLKEKQKAKLPTSIQKRGFLSKLKEIVTAIKTPVPNVKIEKSESPVVSTENRSVEEESKSAEGR